LDHHVLFAAAGEAVGERVLEEDGVDLVAALLEQGIEDAARDGAVVVKGEENDTQRTTCGGGRQGDLFGHAPLAHPMAPPRQESPPLAASHSTGRPVKALFRLASARREVPWTARSPPRRAPRVDTPERGRYAHPRVNAPCGSSRAPGALSRAAAGRPTRLLARAHL